MKEQTFVMIKPDAWKRGLVGEIISRLENKGFGIVNMRVHCMTIQDAEELYEEHRGKDFYNHLIKFTAGTPVVVMIVVREDAVKTARRLAGLTHPLDQLPGTIRGDYACGLFHENLIHTSDSNESFRRESAIFFPQAKVVEAWE